MYGLEPSSAAIHAAEQFVVREVNTVLELGAGRFDLREAARLASSVELEELNAVSA